MHRALVFILASVAIVGCATRRPGGGVDASTDASTDAPLDGGHDADARRTYVSPSGGFEVRFPEGKAPDVESTTITPSLSVRTFAVRYGTSAFLVSYDDAGKTSGRSADRILSAAKEGILEATGGSVDAESPLVLTGHPGRELVVSATTAGIVMRQRIRLYVVAGRLYQIVLVSPSWAGTSALEQPFFDSFALVAP